MPGLREGRIASSELVAGTVLPGRLIIRGAAAQSGYAAGEHGVSGEVRIAARRMASGMPGRRGL